MAPPTTGRDSKAGSRNTAARKTAARPAAKRRKDAGASEPASDPATKPPRGQRTTDPRKKRTSAPDVELDADALEFIEALDRFKRTHNKPFPSWSEVLHVLRGLGYRKAR